MKRIKVATSDNKIWNQHHVYAEIAQAMINQQPFELDFLAEGPDIQALGLYDFLDSFEYPSSNITIYTSNALEQHKQIQIVYRPPVHLLEDAKAYIAEVPKNNQL
jgi:hypothetical protein